jgi:ABC-type bacteriocin/lantibiotic exporter with double-glycine peptidase domain
MCFLKLSEIRFSFSDETVLDDFSFRLQTNEKLVIKGDSGSGKSTLLKIILGFLQPESGEILLNGNPMDIRECKELRRKAAWLPQDLNMGENSVREMIFMPFSFKYNSVNKPSESTVLETFEQLGLQEEVLDKQFTDLSTGQRQRVGITICTLLNRPFLLLDEPTSALDQASKEKAAELLLDDPEKTVLSVSHDPFWVERCDRMIEF